jgi:cyclic beta-1,2-glucan synthetase
VLQDDARGIIHRNRTRAASKLKPNRSPFFRQALGFLAPSRRSGSPRTPRDEVPSRSELFSADQMEQHGKSLAAAHKLTSARGRDQLLPNLAANEAVLIETCNLLTKAVTANRRITPAGEWLLDNFYLIEEQIRTAKRHLPKDYSRELPRLVGGASAGLPRVYDIASEIIAHADGRVDQETLSRFVTAYQTITQLTLGELWAIPIMLRLALIHNVRRIAIEIATDTADRVLAGGWADQMRAIAQSDPKGLILVIADMARSDPPMTAPFVSELARRLQGRGPALALPLTWIEQRLFEFHLTIEQLVQSGNEQQAANQVSISNSIGSLRCLDATDWREFVENTSMVEQQLREDPAGVFGKMNFSSRDRYRHAVERLAKESAASEVEVARAAIRLSQEGADRGNADPRRSHVGFYLIDAGRPALQLALNAPRTIAASARGLASRSPTFVYLGAIAILTGLFTALLLAMASDDGVSLAMLSVVLAISLLATSQLAVTLVNWFATLLVTPHPLPRMDFSSGIAPQSRALVVVPAMLTGARGIEDLAEALEVRFLANQDVNLHFALLTDFVDADEKTMPEDAALLQLARARIGALNERYRAERANGTPAHRGDVFYLLHRPRIWNPRERLWMGYERKRGKLGDLNALLRGEQDAATRFSLIVGDAAALAGVKYVITLDTDTELPRDAARQLVGAMAHPLNRPHYDAKRQRVTSGYAILQPRVAASLPGSNRSWFARVFGGEPGIDPYTQAVSDVYQDAFGEGSFIGKGIYDVDAFELALKGRFPEDRILSHDLLEGSYARSGLVTDVQLYEEYPSRYIDDVRRRRRWIRGDWQIATWLLPRVPGARGTRTRNPLSVLSQWKLFDNLRRSLVAPALLILLLLGWTVLAPAWWWTLAGLGILFVPSLLASLLDLLRRPDEVPLVQHLVFTARAAARHGVQIGFSLACLPYEAYFSSAAILRAHWRLLWTRARLLEWTPSGAYVSRHGGSLAGSFRTMWTGPTIAVIAAGYLATANRVALPVAAPVLLLWFLAPVLAWWMSRPLLPRVVRLTFDQTVFLRKLARRTWAYFEAFAGAADHWLAPDNYQESPAERVANRTSPTNMGLALLADLAAYDFGYLPAGRLVGRITHTLRTMQSLERHHGHFYNWYDTQSLKPLPPRYVSSVDSGNLAGHLLTLRAGLRLVPDDPIVDVRVVAGFTDTVRVLGEALGDATPDVTNLVRELESACEARPATIYAMQQWLEHLSAPIAALESYLADDNATAEARQTVQEERMWGHALVAQYRSIREELLLFAPWVELTAFGDTLVALPILGAIPTLRDLANGLPGLAPQIALLHDAAATAADRERLDQVAELTGAASARAKERIAALEQLALLCEELARMEFGFLYDSERHLFAVGYNVDERQRDASYYDLLASEARLTSFIAIARGQVPQESWFALGRLLSSDRGRPILLSWSGSMFEYLMPLLVMPTYENSLLDETCRAAVERQIAHGKELGVPWGMSESGYNLFDASLNYQYRAFGVPGLGLKRGLADDVVIAPYASALALMVAPEAACLNLERLSDEGLAGRFGLFEAIDYTPGRRPPAQAGAVVRSFMAHHQGMSMLAINHLLLDHPMQKRFESDPQFQATLLLLQERIPKSAPFSPHVAQLTGIQAKVSDTEAPLRMSVTASTTIPEVQLLSNGRYHVMITNAGGGSSRWNDLAITRWREDTTCDSWGTFCYIGDVASGEFWSTAHQPTRAHADHYESIFSEGRAEFRRHGHGLQLHTEIAVSPEDDIELRRTTIINRSRAPKVVEITSYTEVVLAPAAADAAHPAFSNLFVETEIADAQQAILCTRRPRSPGEQSPWMFHLMTVHGATATHVSYETDRLRFIGRGNTPETPQAMRDGGPLSGSAGSVLDPIAAIRMRVTLEPDQTVTIGMVYGVAEFRDGALGLVEKYRDPRLADRVIELAWTHAHVLLRQINASETDAQLYARLANSIIFANASLRADPSVIARNRRGQSGLWGYAISGDLPIVLLRIADAANIDLVRQLVRAHAYWRLKGLAVDLVIWNEDQAGYRQLLQDQIIALIGERVGGQMMDRPGGVFVRRGDQISDEDRVLLESVARAIISDAKGTLAEQIGGRTLPELRVPALAPTREQGIEPGAEQGSGRTLILANELGGFTPDGTEYVITTGHASPTPAPWVNVLANAQFGAVVSESGGTYTWNENAHEFRLTPWSNDPIGDAPGEAYYVRDEETGHFWSPTPLPARGRKPYVTRHGFGYTVFEHHEDGLVTELCVYVARDAAVKFSTLKIRNSSGRPRRLCVAGYVEWVLGDLRAKSAMHIVTEKDGETGTLFARNAYSTEFGDRVAFFGIDETMRTLTCDRAEFIGRNGTLAAPAAMTRTRLSGRTGAALDPCAAIATTIELDAEGEREVTFRLGVGQDTDDARRLIQRFRGAAAAKAELDGVRTQWKHRLDAVRVETPDASVNVLCNGWLVYQVLACRLWARSGFYQSGGAFGFRDQLQDVLALVHAEPRLARAQILLCASRQFAEGDVQHWWHPPSGRGVRTQCSDDYLWLPLAIARYVLTTGDSAVLDEPLAFLDGRPVNAGEDSYYDMPGRSAEVASLYEHGVRAIEHGLRFGAHGLPLMGSGDWNDGMNLVGIEGKGESVWLAFFLCSVLAQFAKVARLRGDPALGERCDAEVAKLSGNIERHGWDGAWYRRAYFDDGSPLGSASNAECQIDSISQSWSVLSGVADAKRSRTAMDAVYQRLVRRDDALIQLLTPPFDKSEQYPGYIRGYAPGVRENGGQYTHAAVWVVMAFAALGDARRAWELLDLINPINHGRTIEGVATYRVEPYVVAADVYAVAPHTGRGGWTWYTGSAGWMYRSILESLLGVELAVDKLRLSPCLPADWKEFKLHYRYRETVYAITVSQTQTVDRELTVWVDGHLQRDDVIPLVNDRLPHSAHVLVRLREAVFDPADTAR